MYQFKVGQKARIKRNAIPGTIYGASTNTWTLQDFMIFDGHKTITSCCTGYYNVQTIRFDSFDYNNYMLEPAQLYSTRRIK